MHTRSLLLAAAVALCAVASVAGAAMNPNPPETSWSTIQGTQPIVRFQLHWTNPDPFEPSNPVTGSIHSQPFGVFVPDAGLIGTFSVPPIQPQSFFDVFIDIPLDQLPQTFELMRMGPLGPFSAPRLDGPVASDLSCNPGDHWDGNVDINWFDPTGAMYNVNYHIGDIKVCPGSGSSYIHVLTACAGAATWAIVNLCSGWSATLVNEDYSPAPNPIPAGWTGFICMSAAASVPLGTQCCVDVNFTCGGVTGTIRLCATACQCGTPAEPSTWGAIKALYR